MTRARSPRRSRPPRIPVPTPADVATQPRTGLEAMPPAGTLAGGRGRLVGNEAAGEYLFEVGALRYRIAVGPAGQPSPLVRIDVSVDGGTWCPVCDEGGMMVRLPS